MVTATGAGAGAGAFQSSSGDAAHYLIKEVRTMLKLNLRLPSRLGPPPAHLSIKVLVCKRAVHVLGRKRGVADEESWATIRYPRGPSVPQPSRTGRRGRTNSTSPAPELPSTPSDGESRHQRFLRQDAPCSLTHHPQGSRCFVQYVPKGEARSAGAHVFVP